MSTEIITIPLFGLIGYFIGNMKISSNSNRFNILLVILLVIAANIHGIGFSGIGDFHMNHNDMLQGLIGGILVRRMSLKTVATV